MNKETFLKRVPEILTKKGEISGPYYKALLGLALMVKGEKYYPYRWRRSGGRYSLQGTQAVEKLESLCQHLKIALLSGNDKQGGKEADYFYLSGRDRAKLADIDLYSMLFKK